MKKLISYFAAAWVLVGALGVSPAHASEGGAAWDKFPTETLNDMASLQHGAKLFVNYCLNCHSAAFMRYNRLRDLQLSKEQIEKNLMFTTEKVGDTMKAALDPRQAKEWFGGNPPDLTLMARSRADLAKGSGADYLYTYLRTYYRDDTRPTGWNNAAYPNVGMPHALWELQGQRAPIYTEEQDPHDHTKVTHRLTGYTQLTPGQLTPLEYDQAVANLVGFMQWMSEPAQAQRYRLGVWVMLFLAGFTVLTWRLNAAFWKDVK